MAAVSIEGHIATKLLRKLTNRTSAGLSSEQVRTRTSEMTPLIVLDLAGGVLMMLRIEGELGAKHLRVVQIRPQGACKARITFRDQCIRKPTRRRDVADHLPDKAPRDAARLELQS